MKTCPLTILVSLAIVMYFCWIYFFPILRKLISMKILFLKIFLLPLVQL